MTASVVAVIQARMGSKRLPGKVLAPLAGAPLLQHLVARVRRSRRLDDVVVATSDQAADDAITALCATLGVACFRGSEWDVLDRVLAAAGNAEIVVRLTADNPFVDGALIDYVLAAALPTMPPAVYASNIACGDFPVGLYVEVAAKAALLVAAESSDPADREHVTWYLRRQPERFPATDVGAPGRFPDMPLTIDTAADLTRVGGLFAAFHGRDPNFNYRDLMALAIPKQERQAAP